MKRFSIILFFLHFISFGLKAETLSVIMSMTSLTVDTPVALVRDEEFLDMRCTFTPNTSVSNVFQLEAILNNELSAAGITSLEITHISKHPTSSSYMLTLHFSPLASTDTRVYSIGTSSGIVTITLIKDSDGILDSYELQGSWVYEGSDDFTLELSGSQPAVTYCLQKDGSLIKSMAGTGGSLNFGRFNGMSSHGTYHVMAEYKDWDTQIVGTARMVRKGDFWGNNYTAVRTYANSLGNDHFTDVTYYNGLGYPEQEMEIEATTDGLNRVRPIVYDNMLRSETRSYVPYCSDRDCGEFIQEALIEHRRFYERDSHPFSESTFEAGTSGLLLTSQKPGEVYRHNDKRSVIQYGINDGSEGVMKFEYTYATTTNPASVSMAGFHEAEDLRYTMMVSENEDTSYVFYDILDKTILKREVSDGIDHDTYFIYDYKDALVCVIQPEGASQTPSSFDFDDTFCHDYCFTYTYDARGNIIEKQLPGAGKEVMIYDQRNRMVLYADSEMQAIGKYKYILYDTLDRIMEEGYSSLNATFENIRDSMLIKTILAPYLTDKMVTRSMSYYTSTSSHDLSINSRCRANRQDINYNYCLNQPYSEVVLEEPNIQNNTLVRSNFHKTKRFYYDSYGRLVLQKETGSDGWTSVYSWSYDFTGNILRHTEEHYNSLIFDSMETTYTYDSRGHKMTMQRNLNDKSYASVSYDYDTFDRLRVKKLSGRGTEVYGYTLQGWPESTSADFYGYDLFSQTMTYQYPFLQQSEARFDGLISETRYQHLGQDINTVSYKYDGIGRLTGSERFVNWDTTACHLWKEDNMEYDLNGNIRSISRRNGGEYDDVLSLEYSGNRMTETQVQGDACNTYEYYSDGNLKSDGLSGLEFSYNLLNLPSVVTDLHTLSTRAIYRYLSDGSRYAVWDAEGNGYVYRGSFVYNHHPNGSETLESIAHDEGRFIALYPSATTTQFIDTWHVKDHLGNVRVVLDVTRDTSEVSYPILVAVEQDDYLPFGTRVDVDTLAYDPSNRYRYNAKEEQVIGTIGLIDYGARFYDPDLSRWTTPDPLAEKYYGISPYAFCNNNPVNFVDPDGRSTWVVANPDGTYTIEGGNLYDNDLNIYVVTYDEDGNMNIGESIGKTSSITSFYDSDKDYNGEIKGWKTGSIINPTDRSGWEFIAELVITDPSLVEYMLSARTNKRYDFKVTNGTNTKVADIDIYRGMPIFKDINGIVIYSSARDVGNIMAGFIAGRKGLSWGMSRLGFDGYQMWSNIRNKKWPRPEGASTRNAQYLGWKIADTR